MTQSARIACVDLNGQLRGKRLPDDKLGTRVQIPYSVSNVDIFGADIDNSPLVFESGDADAVMVAADRGLVPMPWLPGCPQLQLSTLAHPDGSAFASDPRVALMAVLDRYAARGWTPVCAVEIEFFLVETDGALAAPVNPTTGRRLNRTDVLSLREIDQFALFFDDIEHSARQMGLPDHVITSEAAVGQFEITLNHGPALRAADDCLLMKELIKGTALKHGLTATFLPKPFALESGTGLHLHCSVLAGDENVFAKDQSLLEQAVAGCLSALAPSSLIFAPFGHSYARFVDNAHAPTAANWGYDNRTVAVRIPQGPMPARRIEHRVAGGDVNPYLHFAAVLGAMLMGIDDGLTPPAETKGNAYGAAAPAALALDLTAAIDALNDPLMTRLFDPTLLDNLARCKSQEHQKCAEMSDSDQTLMMIDLL